MKIRTKLILAILFIVLFLLGSLTYALMKRSSDLVYEHVMENASLSLSQVSSNLDNKMQSYEEIANTLFLNTNLNIILDQRYTDALEAFEVYSQQFKPFLSAVMITKDIAHLNVYTDNPTFLFANVALIDREVRESAWYRSLMGSHAGGVWTSSYVNFREQEPVISFRKRLNNVDTNSPNVVSLEIKLKKLIDLFDVESASKRFIFSLADGTVLIDSDAAGKIERLQQLPFSGRLMEAKNGSFPVTIGSETYQVVYKTLESRNIVRGMKVVTFIPVSDLMKEINQLRSSAYVWFALAFLLSALLISIISVGLTRRLTELSVKMKRVHKDNFETFVNVKGKDEIAQLGDMFNQMVRRLGQLIQEVYQSEIDRKEQALRTKEVELYALQTQINPHYLFNVLNMIRGKLLMIGERDTAKVVGLLAKSFRMMLKSGGQTIRLADELEFVDSYLQIQQYRFADKFSYMIDIPEPFREVGIPKLCIQPLVENAISHGVELSPSSCRIWITGRRTGTTLQITVGDNGLGIPFERLVEIERDLQEDSLSKDSNIGLRNVHARLKYLYGEEYGVRIRSRPGEGTEVEIRIPLEDNGGGEGSA